MCNHTHIERCAKLNGIQWIDEYRRFGWILGNCLKCGTTLTIGYVRNGEEVLCAKNECLIESEEIGSGLNIRSHGCRSKSDSIIICRD